MSNVRDFGVRGDGKTDDTAALLHAIQRSDGVLTFPRGDYLVSRPLSIPLNQHGRLSIDGSGGVAKIVMTGPGPAFHIVGSHRRSALPDHFTDEIWLKERMPTIRDLEIVGGHDEADGIRLDGVMQPTITGVLIRKCKHGIHILNRARNVDISDCHIYNNTGIGIFLDRLNLHQTNIHGNHISYCKQGGIRIVASEIRNIQICSNDIEYNHDLKAKESADVFFDCRQGTVREGTLVGNTIQAVRTPGGANVRFLGVKDHPNAVGLFTITGNLIGSQTTAIDLHACRSVVISGNSIYSGYEHALIAEDAEHLVLGGNSIDHNPEYKGASTDAVVFRRCRHVNITGLLMQHTREALSEVPASIDLRECRDVNIIGSQIINARMRGIQIGSSAQVRISNCTIRGREGDKSFRASIAVDDASRNIRVAENFLSRGSEGALLMRDPSGTSADNTP